MMKETVSQAHPLLHNVYTVHCVQCIVVYYDPQWSIVEVIVKSIHSNLRCIDQEQFLGEFFLPLWLAVFVAQKQKTERSQIDK